MKRLTVDTDVNFDDAFTKRKVQTTVAALRGEYEIKFKPIDAKRSNQQNRFFWRVVCQSLAEWFTDHGQVMTKDEAKLILCEDHLPKTFTNPVTGEVRRVPGGTSGLTVPEFSEFLEACIADLLTLGIELPEPPKVDEQPQRERRKPTPTKQLQPPPMMN